VRESRKEFMYEWFYDGMQTCSLCSRKLTLVRLVKADMVVVVWSVVGGEC